MDYRVKNKLLKALMVPSVYQELAKDKKIERELNMIKKKADSLDTVKSLSPTLIGFLLGLGKAMINNTKSKEFQAAHNELIKSNRTASYLTYKKGDPY